MAGKIFMMQIMNDKKVFFLPWVQTQESTVMEFLENVLTTMKLLKLSEKYKHLSSAIHLWEKEEEPVYFLYPPLVNEEEKQFFLAWFMREARAILAG